MVQQHSRYYYTRLQEEEKKVYRSIYESWIQRKERVKIKNYLGRVLNWKKILEAIFLDNPELFFIDKEHIEMVSFIWGYEVRAHFFWSEDEIEEKTKRLNEKVLSIWKNCRSARNKTDFLRKLHDCLAEKITYNYEYPEDFQNYTAYGALCQERAVCEGIAKAYKLLCDQEGVLCLIVSGRGLNEKGQEEGHAWNIVKTESGKMHVDVTWNIAFFEKGIEGIYFGLGDREMERDHFWEKNLIPACEGVQSRFLPIHSYKEMERTVTYAVQNKETEIWLSFNRKFSSEQEILHLVMQYLSKNFCRWSGRVSVLYLEKTDRAIIRFFN